MLTVTAQRNHRRTALTGSPRRVWERGKTVHEVAAVSLLGWALLAVLERHTLWARGVWGGTAGVVLLLSLAGPLTRATSTSAAITLVAMHIGVAVVFIPLLARTSVSPHA